MWCILGALLLAAYGNAATTLCPAISTASLQACINTAAGVSDTTRSDTVVVTVAAGTYSGAQIRINRLKNLWVVGDTTANEATQPRILFQDRQHVYTDLDAALRADTSATGTYGQNNGTVWIHQSDNIRLMGLLVDGNSTTGTTNTAGRIFAYGATLGKANPVEIRGNVGVNILLSRNVQLRYLSVTNAWNGISIISPNLGGAFSFPDPNDPVEELVATLPTSRSGLYGSHLIERCRIHDNIFGILFQRDWDLGSVVRNNLFWGNYMRHWGDPKTPAGYVFNLEALDKAKRADGSARSLAYTTVGGAFLMNDVALTPYRIHNNTFHNNATIFSGYYKAGTQHLFYNNLVGRPYQNFRRAINLPIEATDGTYTAFRDGYTQTERNSEMLQYMSEHQRSNRVVAQDSIPANTAVIPNYWGGAGGNFRLYNMRMIRTSTGNWPNARSWSNDDATRDSLGMTWVPDTLAAGTIAQQADTGGVVRWIRHNMWAGARKDPTMDPNPGQNWSPPWIPIVIRNALGDPKVFRETSAFDVRWTLGMPLDTISSVASAAWLKPVTGSALKLAGWTSYEGGPTSPLAIGAYNPDGNWAAPDRRLVLRDTLIETVTDSMVKFRMNVSGQGLSDSDIVSLVVHTAKFYNDVPVSDTLYNQGPDGSGGTTTRVNSVLSSKAWPDPYQFLSGDYNRTGYRVDDSLTRRKLAPDNVFIARIGAGSRLPPDSLYARAEVVLKATLKDGEVVFSNPGVFMFSRPRFQFDVKVVDAATGLELPLDADGLSRVAQAYQPLKVMVKAKTVASLPVPFKGYGNVQMGNAGELHGPDGEQLQEQRSGLWNPRYPNDTVFTYFAQNDSVFDTLRAQVSPSSGTLVYRAVFIDMNGKALPYFIEGRSAPIKVISGAIYQVTIDSVLQDDTLSLSAPSVALKVYANMNLAGRRDTLLTRGGETSLNVAGAPKGETLRLVLQVRDKYGNPVRDSNSTKMALFIRLSQVLATGRYPDAAPDLSWLSIDSAGTSKQSIRLDFDTLGRAIATVHMSATPYRSVLVALKAAIVDAQGQEIGKAGASRDSGIADTTWLRTERLDYSLQWSDTLGVDFRPTRPAWVGEWIPVRLKLLDGGKGATWTGSVAISSSSPVFFHASRGDTSKVTTVPFAGDSLSSVVWIRATDSVTGAWIAARGFDISDTVGKLDFRYPSALSSSFHDRDCDGRIDRLVVRLDGPILFRPDSGVVAGDSVDAVFPHQHASPSALVVPEAVRYSPDSVLTFTWNPGSAAAADIRANRVMVGNPLLPGKGHSLVLPSLLDKAPPVAFSASIRQNRAGGWVDSLVVRFSETIDVSGFMQGAAVPFVIVRAGSRILLRNTKLVRPVVALDSGLYAFVFQGADGMLRRGDSLAIDSSFVSDLAGNRSGGICPNNTFALSFLPVYMVTIDTVARVDGTTLSTPSVRAKLGLNKEAGGRRDTLLIGQGDTSLNVANVKNGASLRLVLQVRDDLGNPVRDTARLLDGAGIQLSHILAVGRYPDANRDPSRISLDSAGRSVQSLRLSFDPSGRAVASVLVAEVPTSPLLVAIQAELVDRQGHPMGSAASPLDSAFDDTTWLRTPPFTRSVSWVDTNGAPFRRTSALVGEWIPVRLKIVDGPTGRAHTGELSISSMSPVGFHPAKGDMSATSRIVFSGDSLSGVVWIRSTDSVTNAWIRANGDSLADTVGGIDFRYPQAKSATFHDQDCDGRVDMMRILMDGPILFRPDTGLVAGDSVDARFPHQHTSRAARGSVSTFKVVAETTIVVSWNPALVDSVHRKPDRLVLGNPLASGKTVSLSIPTLSDKAPPVALSAVDRQTWTGGQTDSLVVRFSETIFVSAFPAGSSLPFSVVRSGKRLSLRDVKLVQAATVVDSGAYLFVFRGAVGRLVEGDSLVIDSTFISDLAGNLSGTTCPNKPFRLQFQPRYEPTQGYVLDVDGDGNADSVHLGFADSLGALPEKIFIRWGTPAETLTVTRAQLVALGVRISDSAFTVPTRGWRGQTVVLGLDTLYNVPRTAGPWDSAWFEGGVVREWLADRVAPVVIRARMEWSVVSADTMAKDTLFVDFSEPVAGCGVGSDPKRCLAGQGVGKGASNWGGGELFPEGSTLLRSVGSQWTILVPRTTLSVAPGDSLKAAPKSVGGKLSDTAAAINAPGDKTPSVVVRGDLAPPSAGAMLDRDGDGRVDAVLLRYKVRPRATVLPSFQFDWCDSSGRSSSLRSDSAYALDSLRWIAVLAVPGAFPATGCPSAATSFSNGRQLTSTVYGFPVRDSAGAVLHPWALLKPSSSKDGYDTIRVRPSEALQDPTNSVLLEFLHDSAVVPGARVAIHSATRSTGGVWIVVIAPGSSYRPSPGDQVRLSTSGSVTDAVTARNRPHPNHPWVMLTGNLRTPYFSAYRDNDKDGRVETAVFDFAAPPLVGTRIRVGDPAGSRATREYVVKASDSGKTRLEFVFTDSSWGQDVTSLARPDLGLLLPPAGFDTTVFLGGSFPIRDEVEPVLRSAVLRYTSDTSGVDTLVLRVSERIFLDPSKGIVRFRSASDPSDSGFAVFLDPRYKDRIVYDSAKGTITMLLKPFPRNATNPVSGDSMRLSWEGVRDSAGNRPGTKAKWVEVVANDRLFPPSLKVTNSIIRGPGYSGTPVDGPQFEIVARPSTPDGDVPWQTLGPSGWTPGGSAYTPSLPGSTYFDRSGTVIFIQTNMPTTLLFYIYDNLGTFVGQKTEHITKAMLEDLPRSPIGLTDIGVLWKGQGNDGRLVATGVYLIRLIAHRDPLPSERGQVSGNGFYNQIVNVGVDVGR